MNDQLHGFLRVLVYAGVFRYFGYIVIVPRLCGGVRNKSQLQKT